MNEITKVVLENEMDLILAHKQSMRFAELTGLSLPAQTTFATAVSEVCRSAIGNSYNAALTIGISDKKEKIKYITAVLSDNRMDYAVENEEGYKYARKLVHNIHVLHDDTGTTTNISYRLNPATRVDDLLLEKWRINLNTDPALSPYEEIKRKNRQLQEMAEKLRESEQQYKSLTDSLPIMIFSVNADCRVVFANSWLPHYTGYSIDQINESQWLNIIHPDDADGSCKELRAKIYNGEPYITAEIRFRQAVTGDYRWHTGVFIAMQDSNGHIRQWNTFMVDIEAQKQVEQALNDNQSLKEMQGKLEEKVRLLNQSNMQLAQFAYVASHDLQEPLRKIGFYSDMLQKRFGDIIPAEALPFFDNMINATERMKKLIHDVLTYSTVDHSIFFLADLDEIIKGSLQDLEIHIQEKNAKITVSSLPVIDGVPTQLRQLFDNLLSNALKFSKPGITPEISITHKIDGNILTVYCRDNGIGFDEKYMHKMFDLFQKLHSGDKYQGTGIGLAICKKIVDIHNGTISAESRQGDGSVFVVCLPLKQINA